MTGSWKGRGNRYIEFVRVLYCKLPTNGKQLAAFPLEAMPGTEPRPQRWDTKGMINYGWVSYRFLNTRSDIPKSKLPVTNQS